MQQQLRQANRLQKRRSRVWQWRTEKEVEAMSPRCLRELLT